MTGTKDRQQLAARRAKLEREMALRAAHAQQRRKRLSVIGAGAGAAAVLLVVAWIVIANTGGAKKPTAAPTTAVDVNAGTCIWQPNPQLSTAPSTGASAPAPAPSGSALPTNKNLRDTGTPPSTNLPHAGTETMTIATNQGTITVALDVKNAPCAAASMSYLAGKGYFSNSPCHRLTNDNIYILQCGDPTGTGSGGPSYTFGDENLPSGKRPTYVIGDVAMANAGANTNGSQFFIVYRDTADKPDDGSGQPASTLDANYTIIGTVTAGLDVVQKIAAGGLTPTDATNPGDGKPKLPVTITTLTVSPPS